MNENSSLFLNDDVHKCTVLKQNLLSSCCD